MLENYPPGTNVFFQAITTKKEDELASSYKIKKLDSKQQRKTKQKAEFSDWTKHFATTNVSYISRMFC